jgi:hypothetical protein
LSHDHAPHFFGTTFAIGVSLNLGFVLIKVFYGWRANSQALPAGKRKVSQQTGRSLPLPDGFHNRQITSAG